MRLRGWGQGVQWLVHHIYRRLAAIGFGRGSPVQRQVRPPDIVEADPFADQPPGEEAGGNLVQVDRLVFERASPSLNEDIVQAPASAVHPDAGCLQAPGDGQARELTALIDDAYLRCRFRADVMSALAPFGTGRDQHLDPASLQHRDLCAVRIPVVGQHHLGTSIYLAKSWRL